MFNIGDKVRYNAEGRRIIQAGWRKNPKMLAFLHGYHTVKDSNSERVILQYPVTLYGGQTFYIPNNHIELVPQKTTK